MNNMIIEFNTSKASLEETFDRAMQAETTGEASLTFHRERDYISTTAIEMDNVVDYEVGKVWVNNQEYDCVYAKLDITDDSYTRNLMITGADFRVLLESTRNIKIRSAEEMLNKINNENNPTSI